MIFKGDQQSLRNKKRDQKMMSWLSNFNVCTSSFKWHSAITEIRKQNHESLVMKIVNHASHCYVQSRIRHHTDNLGPIHPRRPSGSQSGGEKRWDESFQIRAKEPLGTDSHWAMSKFKWMPAPDWAQKMLCIIVPNRRTASPEFFSWVRTRRLLTRSRLVWLMHQRNACSQETFSLI